MGRGDGVGVGGLWHGVTEIKNHCCGTQQHLSVGGWLPACSFLLARRGVVFSCLFLHQFKLCAVIAQGATQVGPHLLLYRQLLSRM